jgi:hypothetical protein
MVEDQHSPWVQRDLLDEHRASLSTMNTVHVADQWYFMYIVLGTISICGMAEEEPALKIILPFARFLFIVETVGVCFFTINKYAWMCRVFIYFFITARPKDCVSFSTFIAQRVWNFVYEQVLRGCKCIHAKCVSQAPAKAKVRTVRGRLPARGQSPAPRGTRQSLRARTPTGSR